MLLALQVFQWQMCSDAALDSHRFCALLRQHCQEAGAKEYPAFAKWAKVALASLRLLGA